MTTHHLIDRNDPRWDAPKPEHVYEATVLVERITAQQAAAVVWRNVQVTPVDGRKVGLKITVAPTPEILYETADWLWHEFTFDALAEVDGATGTSYREVHVSWHVWALTPPGDEWSTGALGETLARTLESLRGFGDGRVSDTRSDRSLN